jgi:hypothetical protein
MCSVKLFTYFRLQRAESLSHAQSGNYCVHNSPRLGFVLSPYLPHSVSPSIYFKIIFPSRPGARGSIVGWGSWGTVLEAGRSRGRVPMRWFFQFIKSFQPHFGPGVDSASNKNEYQESSWGANGCWRPYRRLSREIVGAATSHNPMGLGGLLQR